jgi:hypothetical protein
MADAFAKALDLPRVDASALSFDVLPFQGLSSAFLRHASALPLTANDNESQSKGQIIDRHAATLSSRDFH